MNYLFYSFSLTILLVILHSFFQLHFDNYFLNTINITNNRLVLFQDEYRVGYFLTKVYPIFLALSFKLKKEKTNYFYLIHSIIYVTTIYVIMESGDRAAFYSFILFSLILLIILNINTKIKILTLIILTLGVSSFLTNSDTRDRIYHSTINDLGLSNLENLVFFSPKHQKHLEASILMIKEKPFFGHGPKTFRENCKLNKYRVEGACSTHPHNYYLQLLVEAGIIGFVFVFGLFIFICKELVFIFFSRNNKLYTNEYIIITVLLFINLWPIIPTASFFNNWNSIVLYLPAFYLFIFNKNNKAIMNLYSKI